MSVGLGMGRPLDNRLAERMKDRHRTLNIEHGEKRDWKVCGSAWGWTLFCTSHPPLRARYDFGILNSHLGCVISGTRASDRRTGSLV
jgi:hypothetical protein